MIARTFIYFCLYKICIIILLYVFCIHVKCFYILYIYQNKLDYVKTYIEDSNLCPVGMVAV